MYCLKWQGNKSIKIKAMLLIISLSFTVFKKEKKKLFKLKIKFGVKKIGE